MKFNLHEARSSLEIQGMLIDQICLSPPPPTLSFVSMVQYIIYLWFHIDIDIKYQYAIKQLISFFGYCNAYVHMRRGPSLNLI